ncbi:Ataxin-3 [Ceratobasidium sp. AG-Ba]|nr:Ataxin-3 [Ceratobasidium sp. AG-Ba]
MIDVPATIAFITTVRPYIEPYAEPLLWRGISWFIGNAERPSDAVREVEQFKAKQREKEGEVTEALGPYMYHERQEPGSMLCGQHALNTLLQGSYFTAPDLARIVKDHPEIEENADKDPSGVRKTNLETGAAICNPMQFTQLAFVLNLEQHWFTLRRFGQRGGKGFWFNLNSFLSAPEWVGGEYLKMVLQQAEQEGYTIFVVRPSDPSNPEHGLPETETDILAETLDESAQSPPLLPDITGGSRLV